MTRATKIQMQEKENHHDNQKQRDTVIYCVTQMTQRANKRVKIKRQKYHDLCARRFHMTSATLTT